MGAVAAPVVMATFFNFHPDMVHRAIPDAWSFASPDAVLDARRVSTAETITRLVPDAAALAEPIVPVLEHLVAATPEAGRPLFAANRAVLAGDDPVARLWQAASALREHRGDGHVAALTSLDLDGCEVHVLSAAWKNIPPEVMRNGRGWSEDDWHGAVYRLHRRGWIDSAGELTDKGRAAREHIEQHTDALAWSAYRPLEENIDPLLESLQPFRDSILASGVITFPNPMGLPADPNDP
jgi:hypothetical protein